MAVGEAIFPQMPAIAGVRLGTAQAGIKKAGRRDVLIIEVPEQARVAGVFTRNAFCAAPVHVAKRHLQHGASRYLLVNTGNANAGTGMQGMQDAQACCDALAALTDVAIQSVLPFSTGVIGERLPVERLCNSLSEALTNLDDSAVAWELAGQAILTTDTRPKGATATCNVDGQSVTINGIAKGSGMIKPNMATMLAFVATDAEIETALLERLLRDSVDRSFN